MKKNISETHPHLINEWSSKNKLKPTQISSGSHAKVWWVCDSGHEWSAGIANRTAGNTGCPYCSGRLCSPEDSLLSLYPILAEEINLNGKSVDASVIHPGTTKKYSWTCKNKHIWIQIIMSMMTFVNTLIARIIIFVVSSLRIQKLIN